MKVDLMSDLHLDRWWGVQMTYAPTPGADIAIVAGDLNRNPELSGQALQDIAASYKTVLFVDGNNEFRDPFLTDGNFNFADTEERMRLAIARANDSFDVPKIFYLKDGPFLQDGVAIIGRNGHWDYKADPRITVKEALTQQAELVNKMLFLQGPSGSVLTSEIQAQFAKQKLGASFSAAAAPRRSTLVSLDELAGSARQAQRDFEDLRDEIVGLSADNGVHTIVVVTHTVPHVPGTALLNFPDTASPRVMSTMANTRLMELASEEFDSNKKVRYHLFGHQHAAKDFVIGGVRYVGNPCGNPGEMIPAGGLALYNPQSIVFTPPGLKR